jgi:DNA-directed RNA polymerase specialized sigma subunit
MAYAAPVSCRTMTEALIEKCLPALKRWAHGRIPAAARGRFETRDLVQEAVLHLIARSQAFEPTTGEATLAYCARRCSTSCVMKRAGSPDVRLRPS